MKHATKLARRGFLARTSSTFATLSFGPGPVLGLSGPSPPNRPNIAAIGLWNRGGSDLVKEIRW